MVAVLDTHAVLWYLLKAKELSAVALNHIEGALRVGDNVCVSTISVIEAIYLVEGGRIPQVALQRLNAALEDPAAGLIVVPVDGAVANAIHKIPRTAVPDMPDRIIAATAVHLNLPLVTRDRRLQASGIQTIWWCSPAARARVEHIKEAVSDSMQAYSLCLLWVVV